MGEHINPDGKNIHPGGKNADEAGWLNIYAQPMYHMEAKIVGNKRGLQELVGVIAMAITGRHAKLGEPVKTNELFASDGEGYQIEVILMPDDYNDPMWKDYNPEYYEFYQSMFGDKEDEQE